MSAWLGMARAQVRTTLAYRADFLFRLLGLLVQIYLLRLVWTAVFPESGRAEGSGAAGGTVTLDTQIAYATLITVHTWLFNPWVLSMVPDRVRDGRVAVDLSRPLRFTSQVFASQLGTVAASAPFALVALPFAMLVGGMAAPASAGALLGYLAALVPGVVCSLLLSSVVSMVAFWTLETSGMFMVYRMTSQFLSGALVPLWFMPDWLRIAAEWLPFQATVYTPMAAYLGRYDGAGAVVASVAVQWGWVVVLWLLLRLVWSRVVHRVVVQGG